MIKSDGRGGGTKCNSRGRKGSGGLRLRRRRDSRDAGRARPLRMIIIWQGVVRRQIGSNVRGSKDLTILDIRIFILIRPKTIIVQAIIPIVSLVITRIFNIWRKLSTCRVPGRTFIDSYDQQRSLGNVHVDAVGRSAAGMVLVAEVTISCIRSCCSGSATKISDVATINSDEGRKYMCQPWLQLRKRLRSDW